MCGSGDVAPGTQLYWNGTKRLACNSSKPLQPAQGYRDTVSLAWPLLRVTLVLTHVITVVQMLPDHKEPWVCLTSLLLTFAFSQIMLLILPYLYLWAKCLPPQY